MTNKLNVVLGGKTMTLTLPEACRRQNLNLDCVRSRLRMNWTLQEALGLSERKARRGWVKGRKRTEQNRGRLKEVWRKRRAKQQQERQQHQARKVELSVRDVDALKQVTAMSPTDFMMNAAFEKVL